MAMSGLHEQLEMLATLIVSLELGTAFLGTQDDQWDARQDSSQAMLGALGAPGLCRLPGRIGRRAGTAPLRWRALSGETGADPGYA